MATIHQAVDPTLGPIRRNLQCRSAHCTHVNDGCFPLLRLFLRSLPTISARGLSAQLPHLHNNFCVQRLEVMLLQVGYDILLWYLCNTTLSPKSLNIWIIPSIHNSSKPTTIVYCYIKIWVSVVQHSRFASRRLQHKHFVLLDQFLNKVSDLPQAYPVKGICSVCQ